MERENVEGSIEQKIEREQARLEENLGAMDRLLDVFQNITVAPPEDYESPKSFGPILPLQEYAEFYYEKEDGESAGSKIRSSLRAAGRVVGPAAMVSAATAAGAYVFGPNTPKEADNLPVKILAVALSGVSADFAARYSFYKLSRFWEKIANLGER